MIGVDRPMVFAAKNLVGLLASLPSLAYLLYFLWSHDQIGRPVYVLSLLPLSLLTVFVSEISFVFDLGVMGVLASLVLSVVYSRLRNTGQLWF